MTTTNPLRIPVSDLLRRPGASRPVEVSGLIADLGNGAATVTEPVRFAGTFERIAEGIVVRGTVHDAWQALCSRCLQPVSGVLDISVDELYEADPLDGETYGLDDTELDLQPLLRDALVLELPAVPLCADDCKGLCPSCGADRNRTDCDCVTDEPDPRWAALRSLDL